ncbi:hypothetical protein ACFQRB_16800 [Halobaculum litoreum]|uniref:Uncharacterized protein n=1 Tax=Halobaculum litoreum TaxID=3031998 RepID=A0ABD5XW13_9EURY
MTDRRFVIVDTESERTDEIPLSQIRLLSVESPKVQSKRAAVNALGRATIFTRIPTAVLQAKEQLKKELCITTAYATEYRFNGFDGADADKVCRELQLNLRKLLEARQDSEARAAVLERINDNIARIPEAEVHLPDEFLEFALDSDSPVEHVLAYRAGVQAAREGESFASVTFRGYRPETEKKRERGWEEETSDLPAAERVTILADIFEDEKAKLESALDRSLVRPGNEFFLPVENRRVAIVIGECTPDAGTDRVIVTSATSFEYANPFRDPDTPGSRIH